MIAKCDRFVDPKSCRQKRNHWRVAGRSGTRFLIDGSQSRGRSAWHDSFAFNMQSELAQKGDIDIGGGIFCGEKFVAVKNGISTGKEAKGLTFARDAGAASRQTNARFREGDPRDRNQPDELKNID